jgi:hypothetical protein
MKDRTADIPRMPTGAADSVKRLTQSEERQDRDDDDDHADEIDDAVHDLYPY